MTIRTATELVVLIENTLGWTPEPTTAAAPLWRLRQIEASKINRRIKENPTLFTWHNLELAVAYLRKRQEPLRSPMGVFHFVDAALELAAEPTKARPLAELMDEAIREETLHSRPGYDTWVSRLTRARGPWRQEVYDEWARERRDA